MFWILFVLKKPVVILKVTRAINLCPYFRMKTSGSFLTQTNHFKSLPFLFFFHILSGLSISSSFRYTLMSGVFSKKFPDILSYKLKPYVVQTLQFPSFITDKCACLKQIFLLFNLLLGQLVICDLIPAITLTTTVNCLKYS